MAAEAELALVPGSLGPAGSLFGAGIVRTGSVCGALTGALMAMGMAAGPRDVRDRQGYQRLMSRGKELLDSFRAEFGHLACAELTGLDPAVDFEAFVRDRERRERCRRFVDFVGRRLAEFLENQGC